MMSLQHIRRAVLPSRALGYYTSKLYLTRFLGILIGLVAVLQMLDTMAARDEIMAADGATLASLGQYVALRAPQMISQFIPFSALLATLLVLAGLSQHSEITIMKASGLSAQRILLPMGLVSIFIVVGHFLFNEAFVVDASARLKYWQDNNYDVGLPPPPEYSANARLLDDNTLVLIGAISRNGPVTILDRVSLYHLDDAGNVEGLTRASFAAHRNQQWTLYDVREFDPDTHEVATADNLPWKTDIQPQRFLAATVKPDHVGIFALWQTITRLAAEGAPTASLMTSFFKKLMGPASTLLMPLLGAIAGFGVHRGGTLLVRVVMGMALGFAFFVADNFMLAMGQFGVAPPFMASSAPFFLFLSVGLAVLFYTEE